MVTIWCKLCLIYVEVRNWGAHLCGKQHRNNFPSQIMVQGTFENNEIDEVHRYFAQFGRILTKLVYTTLKGENLILYHFEDPSAYSVIVHRQHLLLGKFLQVTWYRNSECFDSKISEQKSEQSGSSTDESESLVADVNNDNISLESFDFLEKSKFLNEIEIDLSDNTTKKKYTVRNCNSLLKRPYSACSLPENESEPVGARKRRACSAPVQSLREGDKQVVAPVPVPVPAPPPESPPPPIPKETISSKFEYKELVHKHFAKKKITLSDYLTITQKIPAKPLDPDQTKKKAEVLSLCQKAIQTMSFKTPKPIRVRPFQIPKPRLQYSSPLRRSKIEFRYTSTRQFSFAHVFHSILSKIGVLSKETDIDKLVESVSEYLMVSDGAVNRKIAANMLQISLLASRYKVVKQKVGAQCVEKNGVVGVQVDEEKEKAKEDKMVMTKTGDQSNRDQTGSNS